jgi:AraC family transcriptional regulator, regulatory protein of adaptative response / DNA-3-methyladenine glycosylase II
VVGSLPWDAPEIVCRAVQLIIAGALDDGSEADLGHRLGVSARHLRRMFHEHLGLTPDELARSRRAHFARRLLDDTDLTMSDIAFASGFGSLRQFNRTMREVFRSSPYDLRQRRRRSDRLAADGGLTLRLPLAQPYDWEAMLAFLASRAIPGVEAVSGGVYRRTITLDGGPGLLEVSAGGHDYLLLRAHLPYWEGLIHVVERVRQMLGLDFDPGPAAAHLVADPVIGPLIVDRPGLRVPGAWRPLEVGVHAIVSQEFDEDTAKAHMGNLVQAQGTAVLGLHHGLTHAFPSAETLAHADLRACGLTPLMAGTVHRFAAAVAAGAIQLDGAAGLDALVAALTAIPGIDSTAAHHLAMRMGERDAYPNADPSLQRSLRTLGSYAAAEPERTAEPWRPWRSLAATHLLISQPRDAHAPLADKPLAAI